MVGSTLARTNHASKSPPDIDSADVPQAPNLARIRAVLTAIADGASTLERIAEETDISARHVGYAVRAAQALELLDRHRAPTPRGAALLATAQESDAERDALRLAIEQSAIVERPRPLAALAEAAHEEGARRPHREALRPLDGHRGAPRQRSPRLARADPGRRLAFHDGAASGPEPRPPAEAYLVIRSGSPRNSKCMVSSSVSWPSQSNPKRSNDWIQHRGSAVRL